MNLAKTQFISLVTKGITTALGIAQSIIVVRILSPAEFGLVGLVLSIGSVIGVSQHLGIVDGAIREIAVRKKLADIGKVFWVSHLVRQVVTVPLSLGLILLARPIAVGIYGRPEIVPFIWVFAAALILQGLQDVLGATLTGMKKFGALYVVQIITATINIGVFGYLTWKYGVAGFFWSVIVTTAVMVVLFIYLITTKYLKGYLTWPTRKDVKLYGRNVMRIGAFMYLARIFFVVWQRLPILVLGGVLAADELGFLNVSLTFGSKLTVIAMALSEVNLSWMSTLFANKREEFTRQVTRNMHRVLVLMLSLTLVLLFFTPEILRYVIGAEYLPAQPLILLMTVAFFLYALTDIGTSSLFVPADHPRQRAFVYGVMTTISAVLIGWLLWIRPDALLASAVMVLGALLAYIAMLVIAKRSYGISMLSGQLAILLAALAGSTWWLFQSPSLVWRITVFALLSAYILWEAHKSQLLPRWNELLWSKRGASERDVHIICFAGAEYDLPSWTNRQHVMSRMSEKYSVLYIEPRVWILRYVLKNWKKPGKIFSFFGRIVWPTKVHENLYVKAQWNLLPGSREWRWLSVFNHTLNRWWVLGTARMIGMLPVLRSAKRVVVWIYDTEAVEYLSAFKKATVVYDCVDNHSAQAGVDRNSKRVKVEERKIMKRADLVTVTSKRLYKMKRDRNRNVHLVLNAGDTHSYDSAEPRAFPPDVPRGKPMIGSVGALDSYKIDFAMLRKVVKRNPDWQFVFIGAPVVDHKTDDLDALVKLDNVHVFGATPRQEVPGYVHQFDVCMIPYRNNPYNASSFPLKFWEFMATGKPVVVSGVPELKEYRNHIEYVENADQFEKAIARALKDRNAAKRKQLAGGHSWEKRVDTLQELLEKTFI